MNRSEDLRRLLREADPAAGEELSPADRARMRSTVVAAARGAMRPSGLPRLAVALAVATAAVVLLLLIPRSGQRGESRIAAGPVATPSVESRATPSSPISSAPPAIAPTLVSQPRRVKSAHSRPQLARLDDAGHVTRIVFTGPEGTRILWFVGTPDAKELGS
jgi:hypothetical protein